MRDVIEIKNDVEFIKELKKRGGETLKKCFQCATCSVVCDLSPNESAFPRKEMIWASWGLKNELLSDPDIWLCHGCMECSEKCPRGARPADLMSAIRDYVYKHFAVPKFMGTALGSPKYLPLLFLLPAILISILVLITQNWDLGNLFPIKEGPFRYKEFVAHGPIEYLFISGNILIFAFTFWGYKRYWHNLKCKLNKPKECSFGSAVVKVLIDLALHKKFKQCTTNSTRYLGHLFIFYGFLGAMIATAVVVVNVVGIFGQILPEDMNLPIGLLAGFDINNPNEVREFFGLIVKLFGIFAGFLIVFGSLMCILRRYRTEPQYGKSSYSDMLFLWIIWGVAFTGLLCVLFRLMQTAVLGFPTYFIHLILVYFLLWYMPYSKFAHMVYRFLGLVFLKMYGRENRIINYSVSN
ncbi:MAG: quinone-interacting membrane-bound oxidoreductase complex subunit QmoC [Ignavibacteria bacterium]|nr:quinone-interacting membrane-bound oxidoreductase complex subunit QmoC [Ignavibacteria bacterium]